MSIEVKDIEPLGEILAELNEPLTILYVNALESIEGKAYVHELGILLQKLQETSALCKIVVEKIYWVEAIKKNK